MVGAMKLQGRWLAVEGSTTGSLVLAGRGVRSHWNDRGGTVCMSTGTGVWRSGRSLGRVWGGSTAEGWKGLVKWWGRPGPTEVLFPEKQDCLGHRDRAEREVSGERERVAREAQRCLGTQAPGSLWTGVLLER